MMALVLKCVIGAFLVSPCVAIQAVTFDGASAMQEVDNGLACSSVPKLPNTEFVMFWEGPFSGEKAQALEVPLWALLHHHPQARVRLYSNTLPTDLHMRLQGRYDFKVLRYNIETAMQLAPISEANKRRIRWLYNKVVPGTAVEGDVQKQEWSCGNLPTDFSDWFRMILLWHCGGSYIDTEDALVFSLDDSEATRRSNVLMQTNDFQACPDWIDGGRGCFAAPDSKTFRRLYTDPVLNFQPHHPFWEHLLGDDVDSLSPEARPQARMTDVYRRVLNKTLPEMNDLHPTDALQIWGALFADAPGEKYDFWGIGAPGYTTREEFESLLGRWKQNPQHFHFMKANVVKKGIPSDMAASAGLSAQDFLIYYMKQLMEQEMASVQVSVAARGQLRQM